MAATFHIDPRDPLPLYAQLERAITLAIATGALALDEQLPTVRALAVELKLNANTVAKVYAELERQGIIATRRGVGAFVKASPPAPARQARGKRLEELRLLAERFLAEASGHGFRPDELIEQMQHLCKQKGDKTHGEKHR